MLLNFVLLQVLDDFAARVESVLWTEGNAACAAYSGLEASLAKYQNPREADALTKVQEELDETKIILVFQFTTWHIPSSKIFSLYFSITQLKQYYKEVKSQMTQFQNPKDSVMLLRCSTRQLGKQIHVVTLVNSIFHDLNWGMLWGWHYCFWSHYYIHIPSKLKAWYS